MRSYTKKESEIRIIPEEKGVTSGFNIVNAKALTDESAEIGIAGITWVNELGVYGNFERDSNSDGKADIVSTTVNDSSFELSVNDALYGNYAQKVYSNGSSQYAYFDVRDRIFGDVGDWIAVSVHIKTSKGYGLTVKTDSSDTGDYRTVITGESNGIFKKVFAVVKIGDLVNNQIIISVNLLTTPTISDYVSADGLQIFNLTKMGPLPPELQTYFGKTNFADLTASEVEEIAPDYVDSVQTVGYKFGEDSAEVVVNKGRNLFNDSIVRYRYLNDALNNYLNEKIIISSGGQVYFYVPCKANTSYTVSLQGEYESVANSFGMSYGSVIPESGYESDFSWLDTYSLGNFNESVSITTGSYFGYIGIRFSAQNTNFTISVSNIQLEEGSTATEYQPPKDYSVILPEMWSMFGISDEPNSKNFKRVKLVDAVQTDGSIDWSWVESAGIEMINWENALGTYGSFEVDSNSDGLADGVSNCYYGTPNLSTDCKFGDKAQKTTPDGSTNVSWIRVSDKLASSGISENDKVYVSLFAKTSQKTRLSISSGNSDYTTITSNGIYKRVSLVHVVGDLSADIIQFNVTSSDGVKLTASDYGIFDGFQIINFTTLDTKYGGLPPKLKNYLNNKYSASWNNFADISKKAADEIIPDYVHGTAIESGRDCLVWNEQADSIYNGENAVVRIGSEESLNWVENDDVSVVFDNTGGEGNNTVETYSARPALSFDGVDDFVNIPVQLPQSGTFEISFSVERNSSLQHIVSHYNSENRFYILARADNSFAFADGSSEEVVILANYESGKVYKIRIEYICGSTYNLYLDDMLIIENHVMESITFLSNFSIGSNYQQENYFSEMELYGLTVTDNVSYTLDEGTGNTLIDHSGNGNHGTIHGATWTKGLVSKLTDVKELPKTPNKMILSKGHNNIICDGAFISITHTKESDTSELLGFAEGFKATDSKNYYEYQPVSFKTKKRIETSRGYKITIDDLYLDASWDKRFEEGSFTIEVKDINEDEDKTIITKYHGCQIDSLSRDEGEYIKRGVEITAQSKEVIEE